MKLQELKSFIKDCKSQTKIQNRILSIDCFSENNVAYKFKYFKLNYLINIGVECENIEPCENSFFRIVTFKGYKTLSHAKVAILKHLSEIKNDCQKLLNKKHETENI